MRILSRIFQVLASCGLALGLLSLPLSAGATLLGDLRVLGCVHLASSTCSDGNFFELMPASAVTNATEFSAMADVGNFDLTADLGTTADGTDFLRLTVIQRLPAAPGLIWRFDDLYGPDQIVAGVTTGMGTLAVSALSFTEKTVFVTTAGFPETGTSRSLELILGAAAAPTDEEEEEEEKEDGEATPVPAPAAPLLLATGLAVVAWRRRHRSTRQRL